MLDSERNPDEAIDPPDNTGGGNKQPVNSDDDGSTAIDPPDNTGGGN